MFIGCGGSTSSYFDSIYSFMCINSEDIMLLLFPFVINVANIDFSIYIYQIIIAKNKLYFHFNTRISAPL